MRGAPIYFRRVMGDEEAFGEPVAAISTLLRSVSREHLAEDLLPRVANPVQTSFLSGRPEFRSFGDEPGFPEKTAIGRSQENPTSIEPRRPRHSPKLPYRPRAATISAPKKPRPPTAGREPLQTKSSKNCNLTRNTDPLTQNLLALKTQRPRRPVPLSAATMAIRPGPRRRLLGPAPSPPLKTPSHGWPATKEPFLRKWVGLLVVVFSLIRHRTVAGVTSHQAERGSRGSAGSCNG